MSKQDFPALYRTLQGHNQSLNTVSINSSTTQIASGSSDGLLYLWNLKSKNIRAKKLKGHSGAICEVNFSPSSALIVTASMDNTIRIWNNSNVDNYPSNVIRSHSACVRSVHFSPDSMFLVSASNDKTVKTFNVNYKCKPRRELGSSRPASAYIITG